MSGVGIGGVVATAAETRVFTTYGRSEGRSAEGLGVFGAEERRPPGTPAMHARKYRCGRVPGCPTRLRGKCGGRGAGGGSQCEDRVGLDWLGVVLFEP